MRYRKLNNIFNVFYHILMGSQMNTSDYSLLLGVSTRTVRRYIVELNILLMNNFIYKQIVYDNKLKKYTLK